MELADPLKISRASAILQEEIQKHGPKLEMGRNFNDFRLSIGELSDRELSDQFNLDHETLLPKRAFWITCRTGEGRLIAAIAAKLEDITGLTAPEYWAMQLPRVYRINANGPIEFAPQQSRAANALTGILAYVGDAYAAKDFRKTNLAPCMGQLAMLTAYQLWNVDKCYAFIHNAGMIKGVATNHGFCHQHPVAIRWKSNPPQFLPDNWLVWNGASDILDLIDRLTEPLQ